MKRYRARVSGPLLDRIDLVVHLPPMRMSALQEAPSGPSSEEVRARVEVARGEAG